MQQFGRFVDDLRNVYKNLSFQFDSKGDIDVMIVWRTDVGKKFSVDTMFTGNVDYDTDSYQDLLRMTIQLIDGEPKQLHKEEDQLDTFTIITNIKKH